MSAARRPRIGLVFTGDATVPTVWSGTPYGVYSGLQQAGADVVTVDATASARFERPSAALLGLRYLRTAQGDSLGQRARSSFSAALIGPDIARLRTRLVARRLRAAGPVDGLVQIGTSFALPSTAPIVTYEDMTIRQALDYPYAHWSTLPEAHVARRVRLQEQCYAAAHACCMTNSWAAGSARDDYGLPVDKVHSIGVGSHEPRRVVERDWSTPRYLFVGLDWERKNGPRMLRAFDRVRQTHPDAALDVVGGHPPLDVAGVTGHGRLRRDVTADRARLRELFDAATCFVMPSLFEPSAVVYTEAAASGLPSIGTCVGGSADLIGDGGLVVDPQSDDAVAGAMLELADPERAQAVAARAADRSALFTWQAVAERLLRGIDPDIAGRPLTPFL